MFSHLLELRRRVIHILIFFGLSFLFFYWKAQIVLAILVFPLTQVLADNQSLIATQITAPLLTPLFLAANAAILLTAPYALFHIWRFAAPGLYGRERKGFGWVLGVSLGLFITGMLFCFYLVLPYMFQLVVQSAGSTVRLMPDMVYTLDFIIRMLLIFGFCFQIPLICVVLEGVGIVNLTSLNNLRPYSIVLAFIIGMILTPPDVLSQIMLAVPLCLLYEGGILLVRIRKWRT